MSQSPYATANPSSSQTGYTANYPQYPQNQQGQQQQAQAQAQTQQAGQTQTQSQQASQTVQTPAQGTTTQGQQQSPAQVSTNRTYPYNYNNYDQNPAASGYTYSGYPPAQQTGSFVPYNAQTAPMPANSAPVYQNGAYPAGAYPTPFPQDMGGYHPNASLAASQQVPQRPKLTTVYWEDEGTVCYQVEGRGISVSRREDTNFINGTKLLNVAGMTRGRRDGILKSEKVRYVVKIGAMNLKGVWIPFERALELARNDGIVDLLYPLFVKDIKELYSGPQFSGGPTAEANKHINIKAVDFQDNVSQNMKAGGQQSGEYSGHYSAQYNQAQSASYIPARSQMKSSEKSESKRS